MNVIADLCVVPIGIGVSVSKEIAACEHVLAEAGLKTRLHAYGTNIEGEWDAVFAAIKRCHEVVHAMGAERGDTQSHSGPESGSTLRFREIRLIIRWRHRCGSIPNLVDLRLNTITLLSHERNIMLILSNADLHHTIVSVKIISDGILIFRSVS